MIRCRKWKLCRRAAVTTLAAGSVFQVSSCQIDDGGVISAFADATALSDLRNQLIEGSVFGDFFDHMRGDDEGGTE